MREIVFYHHAMSAIDGRVYWTMWGYRNDGGDGWYDREVDRATIAAGGPDIVKEALLTAKNLGSWESAQVFLIWECPTCLARIKININERYPRCRCGPNDWLLPISDTMIHCNKPLGERLDALKELDAQMINSA